MTTDTFTPAEELQRKIRTRRLLTWLVVLAIVMFFAGLTSAYVVSMSGGYWVDIRIPNAFYISTVAILASSLSIQAALWSAGRGRMGRVAPLLALTFVLGGVFTWSQFQGWKSLVAKGNYVVGKVLANTGTYGEDWTITRNGVPLVLVDGQFYLATDQERVKPLNADLEEQKNSSSAYLYVLTAAHLAHLAFGLLSLAIMVLMAVQGRYSQEDHVGLWAGTTYWHFLGGLWIYLLLFLSLVH